MKKPDFESYRDLLNTIDGVHYEHLKGMFRYIDTSETINISKGGLQKEIEFRMEGKRSFGLTAKLGWMDNHQCALDVCVRIREDGHWKDYLDGTLVPEHEREAQQIAESSSVLIDKLRVALNGTGIDVLDRTNEPLSQWNKIKRNKAELERCRRLYRLSIQ